jgi:hypothetical protein
MLGFVLRCVITEFIKKNYIYIQGKLKNSSTYIYNRLYTEKKEKPIYKQRFRSKSY